MIEKERVKQGNQGARKRLSSKPSKANAKKSMSGKQAKKMQKDAGRSTGLSGVDLNKAHVYDPTLDGLPTVRMDQDW